ncbi:hypothetical protein AMTR_s00033p00198850 [Amborella trichopoda]|uniref:Uncharacterized protein n=1 Tax=Amborella trichopoda TaxID=13333 RepID=U5CYV0_AMBTC|nr:hypothetical protein AMTR_s00033p00198850 [Amborella trichopoda]
MGASGSWLAGNGCRQETSCLARNGARCLKGRDLGCLKTTRATILLAGNESRRERKPAGWPEMVLGDLGCWETTRAIRK